MDIYKLRYDGIYDLRTFSLLKSEGVNNFGFDFNPRSFNFIQEYLFLDIIKNNINDTNQLYLHFTSNKDNMVVKLYNDIKAIQGHTNNIFFEFDEYIPDFILPLELKYFLSYNSTIFQTTEMQNNCIGFIFNQSALKNLIRENGIKRFCSNFYTHFANNSLDNLILILNADLSPIIEIEILNYFDFAIINYSINRDLEICYRNVNLNSLKQNLSSNKKYLRTTQPIGD